MKSSQRGFTLIELMIAMTIAMVILGGLMLSFISQSGMYKYQNKRGDATLDLEFAIRYIADDMKSALISKSLLANATPTAAVLTFDGTGTTETTRLSFEIWDEGLNQQRLLEGKSALPELRALRCYQFSLTRANVSTRKQIYLDRHDENSSCASQTYGFSSAILGDNTDDWKGLKVTHFRIFQDGFTPTAGYPNIPPPLSPRQVKDADGALYFMPAFTILIEVEIESKRVADAGKDVLGNALTNSKRRMWRYKQVYPTMAE